MRSLLLGLDVSPRRMGWGLVDLVSGEPVACGCEAIELPKNGWDRRRISSALDFEHVFDVLDAEIQAVYIEEPATPRPSGPHNAYNAGRAVGMVHCEVQRRWPHAPVEYLIPSEWKKLAGLRPGVAYLPEDIYGVLPEPLPKRKDIKPYVYMTAHLLGFKPGDSQDAADAACIAVAGQRRNGENWDRAVERGEAA